MSTPMIKVAHHQKTAEEVEAVAEEFDKQRDCRWNNAHLEMDYDAEELNAAMAPQYASLGNQCLGTLQELALLHTLRPCKDCGGELLYKSGYQIACCSCFGENPDCEECKERGCHNFAENMNLQDAITRWNLWHGDKGSRGRVAVIG